MSKLALLALAGLLIGSNSYAQNRAINARQLLLDNGAGTGTLTLQYDGVGNGTVIIPAGGGGTVPATAAMSNTLRWDGTKWAVSTNFSNNGTDVISTGTVTGTRFISTIASGTAPLTVTSTTNVANLNADMVDGLHGADLAQLAASNTFAGSLNTFGDLRMLGRPSLAANEAALVADNTPIAVTTGMIFVSSNDGTAANRTFTIPDGSYAGQLLYLVGANNASELEEGTNVKLMGATTMAFSQNDVLVLLWSDKTSKWVEVSRSVNTD